MDESRSQRIGNLIIDHEAREVSVDGQAVHLTGTEFALLSLLAAHPRRAFSTAELIRHLSGAEWVGGNHALQMCVSRLRTKLGESGTHPRQVVTVHGYGYRFEPELSPSLNTPIPVRDPASPLHGNDITMHMLVSINRTILWASDRAEELLGWTPMDLEGRVLYDLIHPDDAPLARAMRAELDTGLPAATILRLRRSDDDFRRVEALAHPIISRAGAIEAFLGQYRPASPEQSEPTSVPTAIRLDLDM